MSVDPNLIVDTLKTTKISTRLTERNQYQTEYLVQESPTLTATEVLLPIVWSLKLSLIPKTFSQDVVTHQ